MMALSAAQLVNIRLRPISISAYFLGSKGHKQGPWQCPWQGLAPTQLVSSKLSTTACSFLGSYVSVHRLHPAACVQRPATAVCGHRPQLVACSLRYTPPVFRS